MSFLRSGATSPSERSKAIIVGTGFSPVEVAVERSAVIRVVLRVLGFLEIALIVIVQLVAWAIALWGIARYVWEALTNV